MQEFIFFITELDSFWSYLLLTFAVTTTLLIIGLFIADHLLAAPHFKAGQSNHFNGKTFNNPYNGHTHHYGDVLRWWLGGNNKGPWVKITESEAPPEQPPQIDNQQAAVTFINHASFLIQLGDHNLLTDPIWSDRASPYGWVGPRRKHPPGIRFEDLPSIDTVLISHNHYDHLDEQTVIRLWKKHRPQFIAPLGVGQFLHSLGITDTIDLDWWQQSTLNNNASVHAVPAQHFSGRGLFDRNKTLWCGFVIQSDSLTGDIYFAGDTGYGPFFKEIGKQFNNIHTAIIPIGAYKPRWFMKSIHVDPQEAIQVHQDVEATTSIAMHHGTFPMADDGMSEPAEELHQARQKHHISPDEFKVLPEGKSHFVPLRTLQKV